MTNKNFKIQNTKWNTGALIHFLKQIQQQKIMSMKVNTQETLVIKDILFSEIAVQFLKTNILQLKNKSFSVNTNKFFSMVSNYLHSNVAVFVIYFLYALSPFLESIKKRDSRDLNPVIPCNSDKSLVLFLVDYFKKLKKFIESLRLYFQVQDETKLEKLKYLSSRSQTDLDRLIKFRKFAEMQIVRIYQYGRWRVQLRWLSRYLLYLLLLLCFIEGIPTPHWLRKFLYKRGGKVYLKHPTLWSGSLGKNILEFLKIFLFQSRSLFGVLSVNVILAFVFIKLSKFLKIIDGNTYKDLFFKLAEANHYLPDEKNLMSLFAYTKDETNPHILNIFSEAYDNVLMDAGLKLVLIYALTYIVKLLVVGIKQLTRLYTNRRKGLKTKTQTLIQERAIQRVLPNLSKKEEIFWLIVVILYGYYIGFESFYKM